MRIGLDIDGTITADPELFKIISDAFMKNGNDVIIMTFRGENVRSETVQLLDHYGIKYSRLLMGEGEVDLTLKKRWVEDFGIDCVFEDNADVLDKMPTNVTRLFIPQKWTRLSE